MFGTRGGSSDGVVFISEVQPAKHQPFVCWCDTVLGSAPIHLDFDETLSFKGSIIADSEKSLINNQLKIKARIFKTRPKESDLAGFVDRPNP